MKYFCVIQDDNDDATGEITIEAKNKDEACGKFLALWLSPMNEMLNKTKFNEYKNKVSIILCEEV